MKTPRGYVLVLKYGEFDDRVIRNISVEGGKGIMETLKQESIPKFIEVKGKLIATNAISQLAPVY